jgi:hypothetical protein
MPESPPGLTPGHDRLRLYYLDCFRYWAPNGNAAVVAACPLLRDERRWEHEYVVDAVQARLDNALSDEDAAEGGDRDALHVLAYNLTRVMNIVGIKPLLAAIRA